MPSENLMQQWDAVRRQITDGCSHSGPRDWFESVIDERDERIAELEAALRKVMYVKAAVEIMDDAENAAAEYSAALNRARAIARRALEKA